jgi:hypothetical protein
MSCFFPEQSVQIFKNSDFNLDTDRQLIIKDEKLIMLLFIDHSVTSDNLVKIWKFLSKEVAGIKYGICDCSSELDIGKVISKESDNLNSNIKCLISKRIPLILIYKNGIPQDCYRGVYSKSNLFDYSLSLASGRNK